MMIPPDASAVVKTQDMARVLQELAAPWAEAEKIKYKEETKRVQEMTLREQERTRRIQIEAGNSRFAMVCVTFIVAGIVIISALALRSGKPELAEKILVGLITGAAGFAAGRGSATSRREDREDAPRSGSG